MWRNHRERPDDPRISERETQRLAHDEYDRPRYGSPAPDREATREWQRPTLDQVRAHELMTRRVMSVHPATPIDRAARLMEERDCGALPVVGDNGVLVGMVTDRDIVLRIVARGRDVSNALVADCMTERVFACYANESIAECMRQMACHQVRRMPIVDDRGRLVGVLSQADIARHAGHHPLQEERHALAHVVCAVSEPPNVPYR